VVLTLTSTASPELLRHERACGGRNESRGRLVGVGPLFEGRPEEVRQSVGQKLVALFVDVGIVPVRVLVDGFDARPLNPH